MSKEVIIGVRITEAGELSLFGVDEVNAALKSGMQVAALEADGALVRKPAGGDQYILSGFTIKVIMK
jgi:hypothetical protein